MPGRRPTLIANAEEASQQIREQLSDRLGKSIPQFSFEDSRDNIAWHVDGTLLLLAAEESDCEKLKSLVRECNLRRSPQRVVIVETETSAGRTALARLEENVSARFQWPNGASDLAKFVEGALDGQEMEETPSEVLSRRLRTLTPSLGGMADKFATAASYDVTVLLTGETGTGKTYLARMLHEHSPRRDEPFLIVPCGAHPPELFASTVFGHVKGAFTGACSTQPGKFAAAGRGTILLDEIDMLRPDQQVALLRIIESGKYEMVGGNRTIQSDARLIVASNQDLEKAVEMGDFRADLFYRLNVMKFHLPPLRERPADVPLLARGFAARFAMRFNKPLVDISPEALIALTSCPWPGNVRELENIIQTAVLCCRGNEITLDDLPETVRRGGSVAVPTADVVAHSAGGTSSNGSANDSRYLLRNRAEYERSLIQKTLEACQNNRSYAARVLGISRVTLHKKINQYRLNGPNRAQS
jgi:DNA-binding NtrC family response regulator